jgi:hypothetical protein
MQMYFSKKLENCPEGLEVDSPQIKQYELIIGVDCEYTEDKDSEPVKTKREKEADENDDSPENLKEGYFVNHKKNKLISYQLTVYHRDKKVFQRIVILFCQKEKDEIEWFEKPKFREILEVVMKELNLKPKWLKDLNVLWVTHYGLAEWAHLKDRWEVAKQGKMMIVRKVPVTTGKPIEVEMVLEKEHYTKTKWKVHWKDTFLLAPDNNKSLDKLARFTKTKKIEIAKERKANLQEMLFNKEEEKEFLEYALNDATVTLEYYCKYWKTINRISMNTPYRTNGVNETYLTVGSTAVALYRKEAEGKSKIFYKFRNKDELFQRTIGVKKKGLKYEPIEARILEEQLATTTYHGGLNAAFWVGHFKRTGWRIDDYDFKGYYPACLAAIPIIDWGKVTRNKFKFQELAKWKDNQEDKFLDPGLFKVHFKYEKKPYLQALPVAEQDGIVYPNKGISFCTWPELIVAYNQGVIINEDEIEAITLKKWEFEGKPQSAFGWFFEILADLRFKKYEKKLKETENIKENEKEELSFYIAILKIMANSFYGKLGQGLAGKKASNFAGKKDFLGNSIITNPYLASLGTGLARAGLVNLINFFEKEGGEVISATTDGCMVALRDKYEFSEEKILGKREPEYHPIKLIARNAKLLAGKMLEKKRESDECYSWRTRANTQIKDGKVLYTAKGGLPTEIVNGEKDLGKFSGKRVVIHRLTNITEMKKEEMDLVMANMKRVCWYDYDWKRIIEKEGRTRAPEDINEYRRHKNAQRYFHQKGIEAKPELVRQRVKVKIPEPTSLKTAIRTFLTTALKLEWNRLGNNELWKKLQEIPECKQIKLNDLKNWKRAKFFTNAIAENKENEEIIRKIIKKCAMKTNKEWREIVFW